MRSILAFVFFGLMWGIGAVWSIVGFILYVSKDEPFDWTAIAVAAIGLIGILITFFLFIGSSNKKINF